MTGELAKIQLLPRFMYSSLVIRRHCYYRALLLSRVLLSSIITPDSEVDYSRLKPANELPLKNT